MGSVGVAWWPVCGARFGWEVPGKGAALAKQAGADLLLPYSLGPCEVLRLAWGARARLLASAVTLLLHHLHALWEGRAPAGEAVGARFYFPGC